MSDFAELEAGFDACARDAYKAKPIRLGIAAMLAVIVGVGLGWKPMAAWFAVAAVLEVLGSWRNQRNPYPEQASWSRRNRFIAEMMVVTAIWMIPSALMWMSGKPALQMAAVIQWLANIYYVQLFSSKSRLYAGLSFIPQALTLAFFALAYSPFSGWQAVTPTAILLLAVFNAGLGLVGAVLHHEKLVAAVEAQNASELAAQAALAKAEASERNFRMAAAMVKMRVWELEIGDDAASLQSMAAFRERIHPEDRDAVGRAWMDTFTTGKPYHSVHRLAGDPVEWVESVAEVVSGDGKTGTRIVGAIRNIDTEKQAEFDLIAARDAAEAANQAKSVFLATMSHEIRTPLNGVLGMAQAMSLGELSPEQRSRLDVIRASGESLLAILNDVLDLSKIEAGKVELEAVEFDLSNLIRAAHEPFCAIAEEKKLAFTAEVAEDARGRYLGDPTRLRQVLSNLVSNALKFTERGGVSVLARREGAELVVAVRDTGIGIPKDRVASLFGSFVQADASTTRRFGGTGLGLAISRELVRLMGGDIEVESSSGLGTLFTVRVPLTWAGPESAEEEAVTAPLATLDAPPLRILAAEDNPTNQLVLSTLLAQFGWSLTVVDNGRLAVEAWERETFDLVLMDLQMPEMDGREALGLIREGESRLGRPRTPVIALTANALSHQVAEYRAAGFDEVAAKPIELEALVGCMMRVLAPEAEPMRKSA
jgi:signal transduction histidine kinase